MCGDDLQQVHGLTHDVSGVGKRGGGAFDVPARDIVRNLLKDLAKSWTQGKCSLFRKSVNNPADEKEDNGH